MPAAIAVPAIASLAGGAISAIGQHKSASNAANKADARIASANKFAGEDYQNALNFQNSLTAPGGGMPSQLFSQLTGPQQSSGTSTQFSNTVSDSSGTQGLVKTPELLATRTRAAQAAGEIPGSLAGVLQSQFSNIARGEEAGKTALQNRAAMTGASPQDIALATRVSPAARDATAARNQALLGVNQEMFGRQQASRQEQASIEQMLADMFQNQHQEQRMRGGGTTANTGPGNIAAALGMLAPVQRQVYV